MAHIPRVNPAPAEQTPPTPACCSKYERPHKPAAASSPHEAPMAFHPTPTEPCPGPSASSSHPRAHTRQHPAEPSGTHTTQKPHDRLNPPMKVRQVKLLVRRMKIVIRQPKSHHHRRRLQLSHKVAHNRNRPTPPHKHRFLPEHRMHRLGCSFHIFIVRTHHNRIAGVNQPYL